MGSGQGFIFETPFIDLEIYRLATVVLASRPMAELGRDEFNGRKWEWLGKIEFTEVSRLLVSIAAIVRNNVHDIPSTRMELRQPVGLLIPNLNRPDRHEDLSFREACNKILHASEVLPKTVEIAEEVAPALEPLVDLYGEKGKKPWKAVLDVRLFAVAATEFV